MAQDGTENGAAAKTVSVAVFKPQLVVPAMKADEAVQFYKAAFRAVELKRMTHPKRKAEQELPLILCAELKIGSSSLLVCDQTEDSSAAAEKGAIGGGIVFRVETGDVEGAVENAVKAGAALQGEITEEDACGGGLLGKVKDPFGLVWAIASAGKKCAEFEAEA
ncbi:uncharacterized protein At5g48480-like [Phoenix dactylifera]|uniref:Uncharacterized protein At5g48480-like n=1 Tax=Phoenix dactylifera TaxID=42345 RepID=A0A8B7BGD0_PHODC|nr:uncharacterized protein At5g48480-like [Phoenix dactylifera]